ncbi:hypothetical protein [Picosynechococcus sp. NKBG15041c]|uniref:hypothetical protein n=1 Tax=Picosynechococcus sp. NKBG15041c TaxID=1407650 RepID=UPI0004277BA9|nr:hypothetical protein [Picosynechococcus sp. NKBG15041c]
MANRYIAQINALWTAFLLGTLFHTDLGLMPLFHDMAVEHSHAGENLDAVFGFMLFFFAIPMVLIILTTFTQSIGFQRSHFGITVVYSVLNLGHLIADIAVSAPWYQLILMVLLLAIGLLLNLVSFKWLQKRYHRQRKAIPAA